MMKKLLCTDDWLARHPKIIVLMMVILYLFVGFLEAP
jgi:hypothetical protein